MKPRSVTEYRVLCQRQGNGLSDKRYRSLKSVRDRIGRLTSDEPWRFYGDDDNRAKSADDLMCCHGTAYDECGCGGLTMREATAEVRKNLPPVEWVRVEVRQVQYSPWQAVEEPPSAGAVDPHAGSTGKPTPREKASS